MNLSERCSWVSQSDIRRMTIECNRMGGINLAQGVCDLPVPPAVKRGAQAAIDQGINSYTRYDGLPELRQAIAQKMQTCYHIKIDPETEVIVSAGATGAFYCTCLALLNPGDEVIVFEPYYGYHVNTLIAAGAQPVYVKLLPPAWAFTETDLEQAVTSRARAILINTPMNPSGKVFTQVELELIARFAAQHDLFVFTDEIYEHIVYDHNRHFPAMQLPGMKERTITISALSKTFSVTGWRVGYALCDARWSRPIGYFNDLVYVCAPAPLQIGAARGLLELPQEYYDEMCRGYLRKRDKICAALAQAGFTPFIPKGSYYVLADISKIKGQDSHERAMNLLHQTGVACVPGRAFYSDGEGETLGRFCFAREDKVIEEACRRIEKV